MSHGSGDVAMWARAVILQLSRTRDRAYIQTTRQEAAEIPCRLEIGTAAASSKLSLEDLGIEPEDLLAYIAHAEGRFGRYRLAALFPLPPDVHSPIVYCLDGPRGQAASEHRNGEVELCLYYKDDPDERRWKPEDGLRRLFDLARRHVTGEHIARTTGRWPVEEAPHGDTEPAAPEPSLALPHLAKPGRNQPCTCGSGLKAKKCCWR